MTCMWNMIRKAGWAERRSNGRTPALNLDASFLTKMEQKKLRVKDISASGLYLFAEDRMPAGTELDLLLQKCPVMDEEALPVSAGDELQTAVRLRARVVRLGENGMGLNFLQDFADTTTWMNINSTVAALTGEKDQVRLLRMAKALAFVLHISPSCDAGFLQLISNELSQERAARAVEIVLKAEEIGALRRSDIRSDVPAGLVMRILENGSNVDEAYTRRLWAELLASSSYEGIKDESSLSYAGLLLEIDPVQMRIFDASCKLAIRAGWEPGSAVHDNLELSAEDVKRIAHVPNLTGIERDLNHLYELGLIEKTERPTMCQQLERVNMTPTILGLNLYSRCRTQPAQLESLERARLARAS